MGGKKKGWQGFQHLHYLSKIKTSSFGFYSPIQAQCYVLLQVQHMALFTFFKKNFIEMSQNDILLSTMRHIAMLCSVLKNVTCPLFFFSAHQHNMLVWM